MATEDSTRGAHSRDPWGPEPVLIVTTESVPGYRITEVKGEVFGLIVRSSSIGGNIAAGFRSLFGGEIKEYTKLLEQARSHAIERLIENARTKGANAIIMMRFDSSELAGSMSEIVAYGTAVVIEREQ